MKRVMNDDEKCLNTSCHYHRKDLEQRCDAMAPNGDPAVASCLEWGCLDTEVARLRSIEECARKVVIAWQQFCNYHPKFSNGFEDHRTLYDLADKFAQRSNPIGKMDCTCLDGETCLKCSEPV